jgi:hypothetical protein
LQRENRSLRLSGISDGNTVTLCIQKYEFVTRYVGCLTLLYRVKRSFISTDRRGYKYLMPQTERLHTQEVPCSNLALYSLAFS